MQSGLDTPDTSLSMLAGVLQGMLSALLCDRKCLVWRTVSPKGACHDEGHSKKKSPCDELWQRCVGSSVYAFCLANIQKWLLAHYFSQLKEVTYEKLGKKVVSQIFPFLKAPHFLTYSFSSHLLSVLVQSLVSQRVILEDNKVSLIAPLWKPSKMDARFERLLLLMHLDRHSHTLGMINNQSMSPFNQILHERERGSLPFVAVTRCSWGPIWCLEDKESSWLQPYVYQPT